MYGNSGAEKKPPKKPVSRPVSGLQMISGDFPKTLRQSTPTATQLDFMKRKNDGKCGIH